MSEQSPFAPFEPSPPTQPQPEAPKRRGRKAKDATGTAPEPAPRRKAPTEKPSLKFDLQTILSAASLLNQDDMAVFEKIVGLLSEAGKPGRERLLAAIEKIFA